MAKKGLTVISEKEKEQDVQPKLPDRIVAVGDSALATGFKLAGVTEVYVADQKEGAKRIVELLDRDDVGVIVVKDDILNYMDWRVKKRMETLAKPVVVAVPGKEGPISQEGSLKELVKRALGFEMAQ